jgi:pimeloyl-ACP methyl ester carboxylesterase
MTHHLWYQTEPTYLDVGHSRIPHWRVGTGPDVLFVHGWPLHAATFRDVVPLLADRFTCHVIDLPGCGKSEWSASSQIGVRQHVASLRKVVDALGLTRYALLAHDSGAVMARLLAADDPRAAALVLGNTEIPGHRPKAVEFFVWMTRLGLAKPLSALMLGIPALRRSQFGYGGCFHDVAHIDREFMRLFIEPMLKSPRIGAGQQRLLEGFDWSVVDTLDQVHARIKAPVQLVWGADDPFFPLGLVQNMSKQFAGGASLSVLRPGKLFAHEEFPEAFVAAAAPFLERTMSRASEGPEPSLRGVAGAA